MTKEIFLTQLSEALASLSHVQRQEILGYFEEYLTELEASPEGVSSLGSPQEVAEELLAGLQEQDILVQVPQVSSTPIQLASVAELSLSLLDLDVALVTGPVAGIQMKISDQLMPLLDIDESGQGLVIKQKARQKSKWSFSFTFNHYRFSTGSIQLVLPETVRYEQLVLTSEAGDVLLKGVAARNLELTARSGDVVIDACQFNQATACVTNGDVQFEQGSMTTLLVTGTNSDVTCEQLEVEHLTTNLVNGDISLEGIRGSREIKLEAVTGDVSVEQSEVEHLTVNLVTGDISLEGTRGSKEIKLETGTGDISVDGIDYLDDCHLLVETGLGDYEVATPTGCLTGSNRRLELGNADAPLLIQAKSRFGDVNLSC